jgi:two-component system C4-dicarboxylate transport sensor histidine kinase DctB
LPAVRAAVTVSSWLWTGAFGAGLVLLAGKAPHVRDFFGLRTRPALVVLAIVCATSVVGVLLTNDAKPRVRGFATLLGIALTMWFTASLVTLSSRGATVFALLPVFVAAYHGWLFRLGPRYPFGVVPTVLGILAALALDSHHAPLFELIGPLAIGVALTLGSVALRTDELNAERDKLRAAVAAQALEDKSLEAQRLSTVLLDVLGHNHDIGNSLAAARINADWLHRETAEGSTALERAELHTMAAELRDSLERLARILAESRRIGQEMGPAAALQEVNVGACIERTVKTFDARVRSAMKVELEVPGNAHALVRGGATNLERVVENLLRNAAEGDGQRGATSVVLRAKDGPAGYLTIEVADDGPGFTQQSLMHAIGAFGTTKAEGTGLGLYTTERLVVASGGQLVRANRPEGGAVVRIVLAKGGMP